MNSFGVEPFPPFFCEPDSIFLLTGDPVELPSCLPTVLISGLQIPHLPDYKIRAKSEIDPVMWLWRRDHTH